MRKLFSMLGVVALAAGLTMAGPAPCEVAAQGKDDKSEAKKLYLKVPAEVKVAPGGEAVVKVETNARLIEFWSPDGLKEWTFVKEVTGQDRLPNVFPLKAPDKAGVYRLFVYGANSTNLTPASDANVVRIVVGNVGPQPPPDPVVPDPVVPVPPTPPNPTAKVARFVVVEDPGKAGQFRGEVFASSKVQAFYKNAGLSHLVISVNAKGPGGGPPPEPQASFVRAAQGKELPVIWTFDAAGRAILQGVKAPTTADEFVRLLGDDDVSRGMGNLEPPARKYRWKLFGAHPNVPLIPRAEWKPVDLSNFLPPVKNQDGIGACNAYAAVAAYQACRAQAGLPHIEFNEDWLYGRINGGRDQGSYLEDALEFMTSKGVKPRLPTDRRWDWRSNPPDALTQAQEYQIVEAYECPNFDALASAVQQGFFLDVGIQWYDNYDRVDAEGWLPTNRLGRPGGHAIVGYGLAKREVDGRVQWGIMCQNSWGAGWGKAGRMILPESSFSNRVGGFWAVRSVTQTKVDFPTVPAPKAVVLPQKVEDGVSVPVLNP